MKLSSRGFVLWASLALVGSVLVPTSAFPQTASKSDQWIHVRVESKDEGGETVRVNVPVEMAVKVLPAIKEEHFRDGKVCIHNSHLDDVDLRAMLDALRTAKDGEYVTVQGHENDVRVAKNGGYFYIHVTDKNHRGKEVTSKHESKVEIKVPIKVIDALLSGGKDELDIVAALHALSSHGDIDLVTVKDDENTVRIWLDSKNISD